ncbi:MAG TPA: DUF1254 domain-containing protein [Chlamydiales bacterium]|nr:DUF1254 domain-containing protein [Chlamydiales bacterium]
MKGVKQLALFLATTISLQSCFADAPTNLGELETMNIAEEAYIFGYPLITMELNRQIMTNVEMPAGTKAPQGQFVHKRYLPTPEFPTAPAPSKDVLYSTAWLDLSKEPFILSLPADSSRFWVMSFISGWTNIFSDPGIRATGPDAQKYAITGPGFIGTLPSEVKEIKAPTNMVWIVGKTSCTGTPDDYTAVHALQDQYSLVPLSAMNKPYQPSLGKVDQTIDMQTQVNLQVNQMTIDKYFKLLADLLKKNPPGAADAPLIEKMKKIGLVAGCSFDLGSPGSDFAISVQRAQSLALNRIKQTMLALKKATNSWQMPLHTGQWGTDYLKRAAMAAIGLDTNIDINLPQDIVYAVTRTDSNGKQLSGADGYVIHFNKDQLPPAKSSWSLTMYSDQLFFVDNQMDRYKLGPDSNMAFNPDGSLDIYVQNNTPGEDKESNWLPAPDTYFVLALRLYWPDESVLNGTWHPPVITKLEMPFKARLRQDLIGKDSS